MNPHVEMKGANLSRFVAGGTAGMAWLAAELEIF
jgi:hypothetical protein